MTRYRLDPVNCFAWLVVIAVTVAAWGGLYLAVAG
jgi:hypothetical protein